MVVVVVVDCPSIDDSQTLEGEYIGTRIGQGG